MCVVLGFWYVAVFVSPSIRYDRNSAAGKVNELLNSVGHEYQRTNVVAMYCSIPSFHQDRYAPGTEGDF